MSLNIADTVIERLKGPVLSQLAKALGENPEKTLTASKSIVSSILSELNTKLSLPDGEKLLALALDAVDAGALDKLGQVIGGTDLAPVSRNGRALLAKLFGENTVRGLESSIVKSAAVSAPATQALVGLLTPTVFASIKRANPGLSVTWLAGLLCPQKPRPVVEPPKPAPARAGSPGPLSVPAPTRMAAGAVAMPGIAGPQGLRGEVGPPGAQGHPGPAGPQGPRGEAGSPGPQGPAGAQGPKGEAGPSGPKGEPGPAGLQGLAGPKGGAGPAGPLGPKGEAGPSGSQGPAGPKGDPGPTGPQGPKGEAGPPAPKGDPGPAGPQGPAGQKGDAGAPGAVGPKGESGPAGPQGKPGPAGSDGRGLIAGGKAGQVLAKTSDRDHDCAWVTIAEGGSEPGALADALAQIAALEARLAKLEGAAKRKKPTK